MTQEALTKRIEEYLSAGGLFNPELANHVAVRDLLIECREALRENAMREVQRLGQEIEQEPVAHLWECLGRWSAYLVNNGTQADCAPPLWLVDAIKKATTPPQRTFVGLTDEEKKDLCRWWSSPMDAIYATEAKLKQKNMENT